jgi:hypothetical protein
MATILIYGGEVKAGSQSLGYRECAPSVLLKKPISHIERICSRSTLGGVVRAFQLSRAKEIRMGEEELHELEEQIEHAGHDAGMAPVSLTISILAVIVAAVSLLGHRTNPQELILRNKITDHWADFQAKSIRSNMPIKRLQISPQS